MAAAMAIRAGKDVQDVDGRLLSETLRKKGAVLEWTRSGGR